MSPGAGQEVTHHQSLLLPLNAKGIQHSQHRYTYEVYADHLYLLDTDVPFADAMSVLKGLRLN